MKSIIACATLLSFCFCVLTGFAARQAHAGEYYIYRDSNGVLVISNNKPPPDSKNIKQQSLPDLLETENPQVQGSLETQPNGNTPNSKPSDNK